MTPRGLILPYFRVPVRERCDDRILWWDCQLQKRSRSPIARCRSHDKYTYCRSCKPAVISFSSRFQLLRTRTRPFCRTCSVQIIFYSSFWRPCLRKNNMSFSGAK
jgi:hypothetical protein